ncbi:hypothetical protein JCM10908_000661 [Rhodotorula pacifica]|uniref:uncharacterized protein n=1 Tax=Rhodotorula pacifica TaxID=1495444 RepID=UPI003181A0EB
MATTTVTVNGFGSSSSGQARQLYHQATRAFLVRDYSTAATCLSDGLSRVQHIEQDAWFTALQQQQQSHASPAAAQVDLRRRLDILKVTLLATIRSSPAALSPSPNLTPLLELAPDKLVQALWSDLVGAGVDAAAITEGEIVPTPAASHLHPSLAVSLALAALKLDSPKQARAVAEAWFGSVGEDVEVIVADFASSGQVDWQAGVDFPLDQVAGATQSSRANNGLSDSSATIGGTTSSTNSDNAAVRALVGSWLKLLDLLVFHILPKLNEWDAAGDFVRLQGQENGGWVPDVRVEASLQRLKELQQEEVELAATRLQRQKDLEIARAEKKKQSSTSSSSGASSRRSSDKGKERARDDRNASPTARTAGGSPSRKTGGSARSAGGKSSSSSPSEASSRSPRANGSPPPSTGFASMRDSLSTYLQRPGPSASSSPTTARSTRTNRTSSSSPISALVSYVRCHYATDPVRLVSFVCFVLALLTWTRRRLSLRRARGQRGLGIGDAFKLAAAKVVETVGMATKVTAM